MTPLALLHSPLVGPTTWSRVADRVAQRGLGVAVPVVRAGTGPEVVSDLAADVARQLRRSALCPLVLVAHSGAGPLLPAIADALGEPVAGCAFVDASLPHAGRSWFQVAPPELAAALVAQARERRLPPWSEWFGPGTIEALLPDEALRTTFIEELPALTFEFLEQPHPPAPGWPASRCGYVRLSAAYDGEAAEAERRGWPVVRLDGHHLLPLTDPETVALLELVGKLGAAGEGAPADRAAELVERREGQA